MMYTLLIIFAVCAIAYYVANAIFNKTEEQEHDSWNDPQPTDEGTEESSSQEPRKLNVSVVRVEEAPVERLKYFGIKDSGYYVSVWPKDMGIGDYLEFEISGLSHRKYINKYLGEHVGKLKAEPSNKFDSNAIKVVTSEGHLVGYVPKDQTQQVRDFISLPCKCYFYIGKNNDYYFSDCYIKAPYL